MNNKQTSTNSQVSDSNSMHSPSLMFYPTDVYENSLPERPNSYQKHSYKLIIFGADFTGRKIAVQIDGIEPYFEIRINCKDDEQIQYLTTIINLASRNNISQQLTKDINIISGKGIEEYDDHADFAQLHFRSHSHRVKAIKFFDTHGYKTTHNDISCYYRVVSRDNQLSFSNLMIVSDYKINNYVRLDNGTLIYDANAEPFINSNIPVYHTTINKIANYSGDIISNPKLCNDYNLVASWDIETVAERPGVLPLPEFEESHIISIATLFAHTYSPIYSKRKSDKELSPSDSKYSYAKLDGYQELHVITMFDIPQKYKQPNRTIHYVKSEAELIMTWAHKIHDMHVSFIIDFNGTEYDWRWIISRAQKYGILTQVVNLLSDINLPAVADCKNSKFRAEKYYQPYKVKIAADKNSQGNALIVPGIIYADMAVLMRVLHSNPSTWSLNHFLTKVYELNPKIDVAHSKMHKLANFAMKLKNAGIFEMPEEIRDSVIDLLGDNDITDTKTRFSDKFFSLIAYCLEYNVIDCVKTFDIFKISNTLVDKREMGSLTYTTLNDCLVRANGMKVRNKILELANRRNYHISNIPPKYVDSRKYDGAIVFYPKRGLRKPKLLFKQFVNKYCSESIKYALPEFIEEYHNAIAKYGITIDQYPKEVVDKLMNSAKIELKESSWYERINRFIDCPDIRQLPIAENEFTIVNKLDIIGDNAQALFDYIFLFWLTIRNLYPVAALDANSLYPSEIQVYNLSPEMIVRDMQKAIKLFTSGKKLLRLDHRYGGNGNNIKAWFVRHTLDPDKEQDYNDPKYEFGLYPTVLKELRTLRDILKKALKPYKKEKERLENLPNEEFNKPEIQEHYREVVRRYNYINAKQLAIKIFMNTFYGECGNSASAFRRIELALAITTNGQRHIKMVKDFTENDQGYDVTYGDTDSNYSEIVKSKQVTEYDKLYYSENWLGLSQLYQKIKSAKSQSIVPININENKQKIAVYEYAELLVLKAMSNIEDLKKKVDKLIYNDVGNSFLKFGYEEVLYFTCMMIKKKYAGVAHEHEFNANPKDLFTKGTENSANKKDPPKFQKTILDSIMWKMADLTNTQTVSEMVEEEIYRVYTKPLNFSDYIKSDEYRPLKNNIRIQKFVKRMKEEGLKPPAAGERFQYIIVEKEQEYDSHGRKCSKSVSYKMEYPHIAIERGYKIDLAYYMEKNVCAQLAILLMYMFDRADMTRDDQTEKDISKQAKQYILSCYGKYTNAGISLIPIYRKLSNKFESYFSYILNVGTINDQQNFITIADLLTFDIEKEKKGETPEHKAIVTMAQTISVQKVSKIVSKIQFKDKTINITDLYQMLIAFIDKQAAFRSSKGVYDEVRCYTKSKIMFDVTIRRIALDMAYAELMPLISHHCVILYGAIKEKNKMFKTMAKKIPVKLDTIISIEPTTIIEYFKSQIKSFKFRDLIQLCTIVNRLLLIKTNYLTSCNALSYINSQSLGVNINSGKLISDIMQRELKG